VLIARAAREGIVSCGEVNGDWFRPIAGDVFSDWRHDGDAVPLAQVALLAPTVPTTTLVVLSGFMPPDGSPLPVGTVPRSIAKLTNGISGDGGRIVRPAFIGGDLWMEAELAVVIGREIHRASLDEAAAAVFGYTCFNDVCAAEFIGPDDRDYFRGKSIETFASMGPWIRTDLSEDDLTRGVRILGRINGNLLQEGTTAKYRFPVAEVVRYFSNFVRLRPGDVISLGTPPQPMSAVPGDEVELEVEGIGVLHNRVVAEGDDTMTSAS
jgi:2-keto-4-pentenoate hydratase/2-oxohepta-3-ene-1,7-dioic acid hydratase in catechol pathway